MKVDQTPLQVQAQLQRQLQGQVENRQAQPKLPAVVSRSPYDSAKDAGNGKGLQSRDRLSSDSEIQAAQDKVQELTGLPKREAPLGRTSEKQEVERRQPLGQIIDIRV